MDIFVGNLSFATTEADLKTLFEKFGDVSSVVIMMRKDKKHPKSRGFGFVQMPDEAQALAAITGLNTTEFMGRALTVEIARPKKEKEAVVDVAPKMDEQDSSQREERPWQQRGEAAPWKSRPGRYKGGRRTRSYVNEHGSTEMRKSTTQWQKNKNNPLRWRKNSAQPKPWLKSQGESGARDESKSSFNSWAKPGGRAKPPWRKGEGGFKPWKKTEGESGQHRRGAGGFSPWKKPEGEANPWRKNGGGLKPWRKSEGGSKPWHKAEGEAKPWEKRAPGKPKPWEKSGASHKKTGRAKKVFRRRP